MFMLLAWPIHKTLSILSTLTALRTMSWWKNCANGVIATLVATILQESTKWPSYFCRL